MSFKWTHPHSYYTYYPTYFPTYYTYNPIQIGYDI